MGLTRVALGTAGSTTDPRLPDPTPNPGPGELLGSMDGLTWSAMKPIVGLNHGWLSNADGELLVEGWWADG